jgi:hypothetical protein
VPYLICICGVLAGMLKDLGTSPKLVGVALSWFRVVRTYDAVLEIQRLAMPGMRFKRSFNINRVS